MTKEERKEYMKIYTKEYRKTHKRQLNAKNRKYYKRHREEIRKKLNEYWRKPENKERKKELARKSYYKHRDEILARRRKETICSSRNKVFTNLNKRDYLGYCELCGVENVRLSYHHWDDNNPSKGIWMCYHCHNMITAYEKGKLKYLKEYIKLKELLDNPNKQASLELVEREVCNGK